MRALCWHGKTDIRCEEVPDPKIEAPRDAIIQVTSCAICGSDLHLYDGFMPGMKSGDIMGHEFMGEVVEVGLQLSGRREAQHLPRAADVGKAVTDATDAGFVEPQDLARVQRAAEEPAAIVERQEALGDQPVERFAKRRSAGAQLGGQGAFVDPLIRLELEVRRHCADLLIDLVDAASIYRHGALGQRRAHRITRHRGETLPEKT